jgi:hypothetical protein
VRRFGPELFPDFLKNRVKCPDVNFSPEFIEDFHEPAHMGALEMMGKVNIHADRCVDWLSALRAIQDNDGVFDPFHPHFFNVDISVVLLILNINHLR